MKDIKIFLVLILGLIMASSMAACTGSDDAGDTSVDSSQEEVTADVAAAYNDISDGLDKEAGENDGQLIVATSPDFAPMEFVDLSRNDNEQIVGYDILLAKYIANHLGKELVIKPMSFAAVQEAVKDGSVDMGISGFSRTQEREQDFFISEWYEAGENENEQIVITVKKNEGKFSSDADFAGMKVGAQEGSLQQSLAEKQLSDAELSLYENLNDAATALLTGEIDALAVGSRSAESLISANPDDLIFSGFQFEVDDLHKNYVVLLSKDNSSLGKKVNKIILQQRADGVADAWYEASQLLSTINTMDELGYDAKGKKIAK